MHLVQFNSCHRQGNYGLQLYPLPFEAKRSHVMVKVVAHKEDLKNGLSNIHIGPILYKVVALVSVIRKWQALLIGKVGCHRYQ